jgi:hypothetical protein
VWVQPAARILHLEGLSHSRRTDQGLKQHQVRNLEQLKECWQHSLDTEQPLDRLAESFQRHPEAGVAGAVFSGA